MSKEQIILGINGYSRRTHSASAALLYDGELVAMAEEERFTRRKNVYGEVPHNAIAFCLNSRGITLDNIDVVGVGWDFNQLFQNINVAPPSEKDLLDLYFPKNRFQYETPPRLELVPHHLAHAASSYYFSGFADASILVLDGQGEKQSTSLYTANGNDIKLLQEYPIKESLGYFYEAVSQYIGLSASEPGKTMGLAGYGNSVHDFDLIKLLPMGYEISLDVNTSHDEIDQQKNITDAWLGYLQKRFGDFNNPNYVYNPRLGRLVRDVKLNQIHMDIAASAQKSLEMVTLHLVEQLKQVTGSRNLCLAGGVALNCSMNGRVIEAHLVDNIFIPPFVNDAGVSAGAAIYLSDKKPKRGLNSAYLGPEFDNDQIRSILKSLGIAYRSLDDISSVVARLISHGSVVSWFQGRMEIGPRALGNRSILANPTLSDVNQRVNLIKNREQWRPLAPSFLIEDMGDFVEHGEDSPFMIKAFAIQEDKKTLIPAVLHIDGTLRPQSVDKKTNPLYYNLISKLGHHTGVPAVLNTSFNQDNEPIVCSPLDAVRSFFSSGSDYLAIGDFLISK